MKKMIYVLSAMILLLCGCTKQLNPAIQTGDQFMDSTKVTMRDQKTEAVFTYDELLMGYHLYGSFEADLNQDGVYELYVNAATGSGIVHGFVQGYDPKTDAYFTLSNRFEKDYRFAVKDEQLYIVAMPGFAKPSMEAVWYIPELDYENHTFLLK